MNRRIVFSVLLALVVVAGAAGLGYMAYNAGVAQGLAASGKLTAPEAGFGWPMMRFGYGMPFAHRGPMGLGFGLLGCLVPLFGLGLFFMLLRGLFWRRHWHGGGEEACGGHPHGPRGPWGKGFPPMFEEWHRQAHAQETAQTPPASEPPKD